jgi:DNA replication protein DnaC
MADFDWGRPEKIDRSLIESRLTAEFVESGENQVLIGSNGVGKSMIAKNILHRTIHNGHTVLFIEAADMIVDLGAQDSARALEHGMGRVFTSQTGVDAEDHRRR